MRMIRFCLPAVAVSLLAGSMFTAEMAMAQERGIQPGNVVNVTVLTRPELSQTFTVGEDGTTTYPVLGSFDVRGMTAAELTELLMRVLSRLVDRPQVFVNISDFKIVSVRVKGAVRNPGEVQVKAPADILDVLAGAGGTTEESDLRRVRILSDTEDGGLFVNELQTVFGASTSVHQSMVDGKPGRFVLRDGTWSFEAGDFARNACANLRIESLLREYSESDHS